MAWSNFTGGSGAGSECIPIPAGEINFVSANNEFFCDPNSAAYFVDVQLIGGVLPVVWTTTRGQVTATGQRTARVKIHSAVTSPVQFYGYYGDIRAAANTPLCNDSAFAYAYAKLGKILEDKGIFTECRHGCSFTGFDCRGVINHFSSATSGNAFVWGGTLNTICGDNDTVIEPYDCPFDEVNVSAVPYGTPGKCMGPCRNADNVGFDYGDGLYFELSVSSPPDPDYADCGHGKPFGNWGVSCLAPYFIYVEDYLTWLGGSGSAIFDTRHPNLIAAGCSPCALDQGLDVVITAVDAAGNVVIQDIHIN